MVFQKNSNILTKAKSGNDFPKSPESLPLKEINFSHTFYWFRFELLYFKENI